MDAVLIAWRHPRPRDVAGRCIGRTDVAVDRRKTKRLAHRIRQRARKEGLPREVWTSPLRRCADVGRWLARWGWRHRLDPRLLELDFGDWDGRAWTSIDRGEMARWTADFADHAPGGGESVRQLMARCAAFISDARESRCVVGHAGWISAARWRAEGRTAPGSAAEWPVPLRYAASESLFSSSGGAESQ